MAKETKHIKIILRHMHDVYVYSTIVIKSSVYTLTQWDTCTFLETCYANTGSWPVEYTQLHVGKSQATVPVHAYTGKVYTKCSVCVSFTCTNYASQATVV